MGIIKIIFLLSVPVLLTAILVMMNRICTAIHIQTFVIANDEDEDDDEDEDETYYPTLPVGKVKCN